jgi:16S rRNA (cytidine1402-2'-O)-methyltransferase
MPGILYVVATPIGNLEDITLRALRVLREVDLIACEDTRQTAKLLSHYQIQKPTTSYHEHNEAERAEALVEELQAGKQIAVVSDAGTPCISDPGYRLVRLARQRQIRVVPIPGACSFVAALSASGRAASAFNFFGFLPARRGARVAFLKSLKAEERTLVFFESPERLLEALHDLRETLGHRQITIARELTKIYEELFSGTVQEGIEYFGPKKVKGEIVLIVEAAVREIGSLDGTDLSALRQRVDNLAVQLQISRTEAIKQVSRELNVSRRKLYQLLLKGEHLTLKGESRCDWQND